MSRKGYLMPALVVVSRIGSRGAMLLRVRAPAVPGFRHLHPEYLRELREICRQEGCSSVCSAPGESATKYGKQ